MKLKFIRNSHTQTLCNFITIFKIAAMCTLWWNIVRMGVWISFSRGEALLLGGKSNHYYMEFVRDSNLYTKINAFIGIWNRQTFSLPTILRLRLVISVLHLSYNFQGKIKEPFVAHQTLWLQKFCKVLGIAFRQIFGLSGLYYFTFSMAILPLRVIPKQTFKKKLSNASYLFPESLLFLNKQFLSSKGF